jgi:DNA-binding response OmpR family regulator
MGRLRRKLESKDTGDAAPQSIIKSVRGAGYLLAVPVAST